MTKSPIATKISPTNLDEDKTLANRLKALGHPVRLEIISRLTTLCEPCCGDVCDCLPLAQSTVSQHLEILRKAGLIISRQSGNRSCFSIDQSAFESVSSALNALGAPRELGQSPTLDN
ncbi:MAG: transcriptional regulator [Hyphomicrobiales bacterium]|nr:MAG: transcriptional regulator [Hyphomicrobiales bacterium]